MQAIAIDRRLKEIDTKIQFLGYRTLWEAFSDVRMMYLDLYELSDNIPESCLRLIHQRITQLEQHLDQVDGISVFAPSVDACI